MSDLVAFTVNLIVAMRSVPQYPVGRAGARVVAKVPQLAPDWLPQMPLPKCLTCGGGVYI